MWEYRCRYRGHYDGDTIDVTVDLGFGISHDIRLRLLNIDTPEVRGVERPEGLAAKQFVTEWIALRSIGNDDWPLVVRTRKTGKYGRWLANIWPTFEWHENHNPDPSDPLYTQSSLVEALKEAGHDTEDWKDW